ncbi:MAG: hypothetical protein ACRDRV_02030 [Pseudonocardiaceae bacterium]
MIPSSITHHGKGARSKEPRSFLALQISGKEVQLMETTWELADIEDSDFDVLGNKCY